MNGTAIALSPLTPDQEAYLQHILDHQAKGYDPKTVIGGPKTVIGGPRIRRATLADMPFLVALAKEKYPARTIEQGIPWMEWAIQNKERLVLVGSNSAGVAQVSWNYGFERRARLDMLSARTVPGAALEALRMVRMMVAWAKEQGATGTFRLDADTGIDFGPFAKRLGGKPVTHTRYEIPL